VNFGYGGGFRLAYQNSANFLIAKLAPSGLIYDTLDRYCDTKHWRFCKYKDQFKKGPFQDHNSFLWSEASPIKKLGWFYDQREQNEIAFYTIKTFPWKFMRIGIRDTITQIQRFNEDLYLMKNRRAMSPVLRAIQSAYPCDYLVSIYSRACSGLSIVTKICPVDTIKFQQFILGFVITLIFILSIKRRFIYLYLLFFSFLFIFINALVLASLSGITSRYQGRVMWLLSFCLAIFIIGFIKDLKSRSSEKAHT
jgi:hypothetical protein